VKIYVAAVEPPNNPIIIFTNVSPSNVKLYEVLCGWLRVLAKLLLDLIDASKPMPNKLG